MRKIIIILSIGMCLNSMAQTIVDERLVNYYLEFIEEGMSRGYDVIPLLNNNLKFMVITDIDIYDKEESIYTAGLYYHKEKTILIDKSVINNPLELRFIVFHEMIHALALKNKHQKPTKGHKEIMGSVLPLTFDRFGRKNYWKQRVDNMFKFAHRDIKRNTRKLNRYKNEK